MITEPRKSSGALTSDRRAATASLSSTSGLLPTSMSCVASAPRVRELGVSCTSPTSSTLAQKMSAPSATFPAFSRKYSNVTPPCKPLLGGVGANAKRPLGFMKWYRRSRPASGFGSSLFIRPSHTTRTTSVALSSAVGSTAVVIMTFGWQRGGPCAGDPAL